MATESATRAVHQPIAPLVPIAMAACAGIVWDRYGATLAMTGWLLLTLAAGLLAVAAGRRPILSRVAILVVYATLAAAWHHASWWDVAPDDLSRIATAQEQPAWLRGVVVELPEYRRNGDITRFVLAATGASDGVRWHRASGRVQAMVPGDRTDLAMGRPVFAAGRLAEIEGPKNPGEVDFRMLMRARGICVRLFIPASDGVWPDPEGRTWIWPLMLGRMRTWSAGRLEAGLNPKVVPLASALLLGRRSLVDGDVTDAFARTGTTHLLAISGLHLQVLAYALGRICILCGVGRKRSWGIVGVATLTYGCLVGWSPSVTRSVVMTLVLCLGLFRDRRPRPANLLAFAALATLALHPPDLFDVGCQLSFLAVATLFWIVGPCVQMVARWNIRPHWDRESGRFSLVSSLSPLDELERRYEPRWRGIARGLRWRLVEGMTLSAIIWLVGLPLVAYRFHVSSPIGILLNVPLVPMTSVALMLAGATLLLSAIHPLLAYPAAQLCGALLWLTETLVVWGERQPWGHSFVAGPSWWWVLGFYASLALAVWRWNAGLAARDRDGASASSPRIPPRPPGRPAFRPAVLAFGVWLLVPLATRYVFSSPHGLMTEILAVDHGLAVILQAEPRHATLYDCGRMRDPGVGRRVIAPALWAHGIERLDAVILSHADSDHYNGLPDLLERLPIGAVLVPPGFGGARNDEAESLLKLVRSHGIPVREIVAGDHVAIGSHLDAVVVHPSVDFDSSAPDNAHSVVMELEHDRRRILLTGDLEGAGREALLARRGAAYDAVLSPHHGGRAANPPEFFEWAHPGLVIASQREPLAGTADPLRALRVPLLRTWDVGAVRIAWRDADLNTSSFLADPSPKMRLQSASTDDPRPSLASRVLAVIVGVTTGFLLCAVLTIVEWGAWTLIRPGRSKTPRLPEPPGWTPISITAGDGATLRGSWRAPGREDGRTVLLLHGFGEDRSQLVDRAEWLAAQGFGVALLDSRGRGESGGPFTTFGALESADLASWASHLRAQIGEHSPILAWGRSMGSAIALRAAAEGAPLAGVILEAPYADLVASVGSWLRLACVPGFFSRPILWRAGRICGVSLTRPRPLESASRATLPVLILHGSSDPIVPPSVVDRLAASFASAPRVLNILDARHNDVFPLANEEVLGVISEFLGEKTGSGGTP